MKYYMIQRGETRNEHVLHAFDTPESRTSKTAELIYGEPPNMLDAYEESQWEAYCDELKNTGSIEFEGDPGLEWFNATPAAPTPGDTERLRQAATKLSAKLELIHADPLYQSVWLCAANHHIDYSNGPKYEQELAELRAALQRPARDGGGR